MDDELLSLRSFDIYKPVDVNHDQPHEVQRSPLTNKRMVHLLLFEFLFFKSLINFWLLQDIGRSHPDEPGRARQQ